MLVGTAAAHGSKHVEQLLGLAARTFSIAVSSEVQVFRLAHLFVFPMQTEQPWIPHIACQRAGAAKLAKYQNFLTTADMT
jgi:hypothetical protein